MVPGPAHVAQLASHAPHVVVELAKCVEGHVAMHAPPSRNGEWLPGHEVHASAPGPLHALQLVSHGWHALLPSAYHPSEHSLKQWLPCLYGADAAHVTQSAAPPPEHVEHVSLHAAQR